MAQESVLAIEFDFSNPGARSVALGGAFAGLADDATAAFANPAGLVQLIHPEGSIEGRSWLYSTPFTEGGRMSGEPTGIGIDTSDGLRIGESSETISGFAFLSAVYPKNRWSVALYRHQLANFEFFSETRGLLRAIPGGGTERFPELRTNVDFEIVAHGLAAAYSVTKDFSLGAGISHFDGSMQAAGEEYNALTTFDPNPYLPEELNATTYFMLDSTDWALSAGFLWNMAAQWRLGGFYREGPDFVLRAEAISGPGGEEEPDTLLYSVASPVSMPDVYGMGLSYRSKGESLTVGFEWDHVEYSTIIDSLDTTYFPPVSAIDDVDEFHLGGEYILVDLTPILALRAGAWLDPDHRLRASDSASELIHALRQPGDDEIHLTAGVGIIFEKTQLDIGIDLSEAIDIVSITLIRSF
jgi:hypothetical protein